MVSSNPEDIIQQYNNISTSVKDNDILFYETST